MSSVGCSLAVRSGCCLYAASPFTYAIRPECSAGLVVTDEFGQKGKSAIVEYAQKAIN